MIKHSNFRDHIIVWNIILNPLYLLNQTFGQVSRQNHNFLYLPLIFGQNKFHTETFVSYEHFLDLVIAESVL